MSATNEPIVRHWPNTKIRWMTYQVGRMVNRQEIVPQFPGRAVVDTNNFVAVFKLMGWGKTEEDAVKMAHKNGI